SQKPPGSPSGPLPLRSDMAKGRNPRPKSATGHVSGTGTDLLEAHSEPPLDEPCGDGQPPCGLDATGGDLGTELRSGEPPRLGDLARLADQRAGRRPRRAPEHERGGEGP